MPDFLKCVPRNAEFPQDFPMWCVMVSSYCLESNLDDVIIGDKLTADEQEALRIALEKICKASFNLDLDYTARASELFAQIQKKARVHFTRAFKDAEWKKTLADDTLGDSHRYVSKLTYLKYMEMCTQNKEEQVVTQEFLSRKMLDTVTPDVRAKILKKLKKGGPWQKRKCLDIQVELKQFARSHFPSMIEESPTCSGCGCVFHSRPNCPMK